MQPEQQQRIMGYFIEEAKDHLNTIEQGLLNLQGTLDDSEMVNEVFRAAHSVKGGAAMLGLSSIQQTSHQLEDYFKILKETPGIRADQKLETLLLQVSDTLSGLLEQLQSPFGLTEEASETAINNAKPVFREIEQHLRHLTSIANPNATKQTVSTPARTLIFQQQVPIVMRDLLDLFKQLDANPSVRQTLQLRCEELASLTLPFQLPGWDRLMGMIVRAVAHPENSGRVMAGVIIKELKQAQEKVLANRDASIVPSSLLVDLVPLVTESAVDDGILLDSDDLFGDDPFAMLSTHEVSSHDDLGDNPNTSAANDSLNDSLFGGFDGLNDLNLDTTTSNDDFAALLEDSGPEMGVAELNSLADLFEGEMPDLTSTWQDEEILFSTRHDSLALDLNSEPTSSDFEAFLLEPESIDSVLTDNSLDDLFGDDLLADLSVPAIDSSNVVSSEDALDLAFLDDLDEPTPIAVSPQGDDVLGLSMLESDFGENLGEDTLNFDDLSEFSSSSNRSSDLLSDDANASLNDLGDLFMGLDAADLSFDEAGFGDLSLGGDPGAMEDFDNLNLALGQQNDTSDSDFDDLFSLDSAPNVKSTTAADDLLGITELFAIEDGEDAPVVDDDTSLDVDNGDSSGQENDAFSFLGEDPPTLLDLTDPDAESELFSDLNHPLFSENLESDTEMQFDPGLRLNSLDTTDNDWTMPGSELDQLMQDGEAESDLWSELNDDEENLLSAAQNQDTMLADLDDLDSMMGLDDLEGDLEDLNDLSSLDDTGNLDDLNSLDLDNLGSLDDLNSLDDLDGLDDLNSLDDLDGLDDLNSLDDLGGLDNLEPSGVATSDDFWGDLGGENSDESSLTLADDSPDVSLESLDLDSLSLESLDFDRTDADLPEASIAYDDTELPMDLWDDLPNDLADEQSDAETQDSSGLDGLDLLLGGAALGAVGVGVAGMVNSQPTSSPQPISPPVDSPIESSENDLDLDLDAFDWGNSNAELDAELDLDNLGNGDLDDLNDFDFGSELEGYELANDAAISLDDLNNPNADQPSLETFPEDLTDQEFGDLDRLLSEPAGQTDASQDPFMDLEELLSSNPDLPAFAATGASVGVAAAIGASALDDPEFDDLERLLEDTDKSSGTQSAGTRGAIAARRTVRPSSKGFSEQTMRVPVKHLDNLSNLVGELVVNRNSLEQDQERLRQSLDNLLYQVQQLSDVGQRMQDLYERSLLESSLLASRQSYRMAGSLPVSVILDPEQSNDMEYDPLEMDRFTGFHSLSQEMIELIVRVRESASDIEFIVDETDQVTRNFRQVTTQLQEGLTRSRMVPFAQTADRLPRAVRDIAMKCGKQAELVIEGRETPIDKMLLEHLYDPMTHLVNNAITHGIETPEERRRAGKPETGRITIRAFHQGNQTVISVSDDGAGVDVDRVKHKAIEKNLITAAESQTMGRIDVYDLLFHPGFTTRDQADDFAGRGVGMDVVRTSLSEIRGAVTTDSSLGKGTTFTIRLPLTLSISKALCCISDRARIAFPMDGVEDMLDMPKDRVQTNADGHPCITWRDTQLILRPLTELLAHNRHLGRGNVYGGSQEEDMISIVVLRSAGNYLALQVDQVLGEQEIVIKQLEGPVPKPVGIAGATVLGDGRIMPIADVLELIDLSIGRIRRDSGSMWDQGGAIAVEALPAKTEPMVLIVDDSITVRELLSMTFNKVGYRVEQARDGQEAWEKLRSGLPCDIVFCDIEMPRMDGLELLSRIQKDPNLKALPIAMLTSRGADRHRQMASSLGASGYFTKPYLEEALLDAAARMLKGEVLLISDRDE